MPRVYKRNMVESAEHESAQQPARTITDNNEMTPVVNAAVDRDGIGGEIETAGRFIKRNADGKIISNPTRGKKWTDEMAFMNEEVTVMVHTTTDKNADPMPTFWVNGRVQRFLRGHEQKVRRVFVERMARAKGTTYTNVKLKDAEGEDKYEYLPTTADVCQFVVIGDSKKGEEWLKSLRKEQ